jgi:hypothetical protein
MDKSLEGDLSAGHNHDHADTKQGDNKNVAKEGFSPKHKLASLASNPDPAPFMSGNPDISSDDSSENRSTQLPGSEPPSPGSRRGLKRGHSPSLDSQDLGNPEPYADLKRGLQDPDFSHGLNEEGEISFGTEQWFNVMKYKCFDL